MAILQAKTPEGLFKQIKPDYYSLRASKVDAPTHNIPENAMHRHYYQRPLPDGNFQNRAQYYKMYNGTGPSAQKAANENNAVYGTHDPRKIYTHPLAKKKINPLPKSNVGPYGQVRLPEQWKFKTATGLADEMLKK